MTRRQIAARVKTVLILELGISLARARQLSDDTEFVRDLAADSLDLAALPAALEEEFAIRLSDDEADFCKTVGTAIDLIETKLENKSAAQ